MRSMGFPIAELPALAHQVSDEASIVRLFDDCARQFPGRTAIVCSDARVTYAELDARSTTVAAILRALGAREDEPIALLADPSVEMVVAMLAAIKAGCAYLPIDPGLPERRIAAILEASRTRFLLRATERHAGLACEHVLDLRGALDTARAIERRHVVGDLAYVIYTSGTTGTPKGVMVRQRSLVNYVLWFRATYGIDHRAVAPLLTSYAFDLGYTSLWTTLLSGGEVHLVGDELVTNMTRLLAYFRAHQVTFVKLTPSLFHAIVHSHAFLASDSCASLRLVVSGGETIRCEDLRRFYDRYPDALIVNHYGPTETTIGVCTIPIPPRELDAFARRPVIGRPIGGVSAYIVDANLCPLDVGEIGELVIAGVGVARGYLYQPELTAERFITPAFADGQPAYRTGDLARWTHEGTIEFLGRIDRQVKIMGYRIELGEIEARLQKLDGVQAAIVLPVITRGDTRQLCAYVVARKRAGARIDQAAMRRQLSNDLPPYMVPAFIVEIDAIPLTANGKLDVGALPAREPRAGSPPITARLLELERTIAAAWQLALDISSIDELGPDDHFFALGGDSISAALVASQLESQLGVALSARAIYDAPTLAQQAGLVQRALGAPAPAREVFAPFDPRDHAADEYTPSHEQELYIHRLENDPVAMAGTLNLRFRGDLDLECLRRALETIHHRHETLRTTFARRGDARIARVQPPTRFDLPVHDLSEGSQANGDTAVLEIMRDQLGQPFDREHGPLVRTLLVRRDARDHHLIFAYCHINIDRWSIVILMREVLDLYCALMTGAPSLLPALPNQYRDYAAWLTRRATAEAVSASLARSRPVRAGSSARSARARRSSTRSRPSYWRASRPRASRRAARSRPRCSRATGRRCLTTSAPP